MDIYAIKHQISAARLRLIYFEQLHSPEVEQEIRSMKAKIAALEGE